MPRGKNWKMSPEVAEAFEVAEHEVSVMIGRYSKARLRHSQKYLKQLIFERVTEILNQQYRSRLLQEERDLIEK